MEPTLPAAVTKAYDIVLWLVDHVGKFPRSHRFILGDRIETKILTVWELLIRAAYSREKKSYLDQANLELQIVRLLIRLGKDLGLTSVRQYDHITGELIGLGQQVGGWGKST
jgi:23S rRNA-intervening sequence protein